MNLIYEGTIDDADSVVITLEVMELINDHMMVVNIQNSGGAPGGTVTFDVQSLDFGWYFYGTNSELGDMLYNDGVNVVGVVDGIEGHSVFGRVRARACSRHQVSKWLKPSLVTVARAYLCSKV